MKRKTTLLCAMLASTAAFGQTSQQPYVVHMDPGNWVRHTVGDTVVITSPPFAPTVQFTDPLTTISAVLTFNGADLNIRAKVHREDNAPVNFDLDGHVYEAGKAGLKPIFYSTAPIPYIVEVRMPLVSEATLTGIRVVLAPIPAMADASEVGQIMQQEVPPLEPSPNGGGCNCPQPAYVTRAGWGCPQGAWATTQTTPTHLVVHHEAPTMANPNVSANWAQRVLGIWNYHTATNGWSDIGYNHLIDPNGIVYEGRYGSGSANPTGAHWTCNTGSMGVCMLGDYTSVNITSAADAKLEQLLAWKACQFGLNVTGSALNASQGATMPVICGHRDGPCSSTACPGNTLYAALPSIRTGTQALLNACSGSGGGGSEDITVANIAASPTSVPAGGTVSVAADQSYSGTQLDTDLPSFDLDYYLSTDCNLSGNDVLLGGDISGLGSDDPVNPEDEDLIIPSGTAPGNYYILFVADADGELAESDENNTACVAVTVTGGNSNCPDPGVSSLSVQPWPPVAGQNFTVTVVTQNDGTGPTLGADDPVVTWTIDGVFQDSDIESSILDPGETDTETLVSNNFPAGTYEVCATLSVGSECSNGSINNQTCLTFTVEPCSVGLPTATASHPASAGTYSVATVGTNFCQWDAAEGCSWVTLLSSGGQTLDDLVYQLAANAGPARSCQITLDNGQILTVTQAAGCIAPVVNVAGPSTVCSGSSLQMTVQGCPDCSYVWSNGQSGATISFSPVISGSVTVVATNSCGLTSTASHQVLVNNPATVTISQAGEICGSGVVLSVPGFGLTDMIWSSNVIGSSTTVFQGGVYEFSALDQNGCSVQAQTVVAPGAPPAQPVILNGSYIELCAGMSVELCAEEVPGAELSWSIGQAISPCITVAPSASAQYFVSSVNGCGTTPSAITTVVVVPSPNPAVLLPSQSTICSGDSIQFYSTTTCSNCGLFILHDGVGLDDEPPFVASEAGQYQIFTINPSGCTSLSGTATVTVNPAPIVDAGFDTLFTCENQVALLEGYSNAPARWSPLWLIDEATFAEAFVSPESTTTYYLTATNPTTGCSNTDSVLVIVEEIPTPIPNTGPWIQDGLQYYVFNCYNQNEFDTWFWQFGDGQFYEGFNPFHHYAEPGMYWATLTGCVWCSNEYVCDSVQFLVNAIDYTVTGIDNAPATISAISIGPAAIQFGQHLAYGIFDATGRLVLRSSAEAGSVLSMTGFVPGLYFIEYSNRITPRRVEKFIVR